MHITKMRLLLSLFGIALFLFSFSSEVRASHSWGNYHWARTSNPFTLKLGDNLSSSWDPYLATTSSDWSVSSVLDTTIVSGGTNPRNCRASSGRVEVCNSKYGNNGWLGLAQIWASGNHITQGVTKVNDTYFNLAKYNTSAWKNLVMCQEAGHTLGLDHQDENYGNTNLGTCMDYTSDPDGPPSNEHPNSHDYEQLETIYSHLDTLTSVKSSSQNLPFGLLVAESAKNSDFENRSEWGKEIRNNGYVALFERDLGASNKLFTFVIWAKD
ncbi:hypothetical protein A2715_05870 [Candidatus Woesebacteria bacterium RIFCSPHIGHO2_01_FULL_39_32]|uniref:Peptidase M10 metallopeptidase domain-containing protein n=2 Tax=Candidatus Woeseibacteriota TaxID=1752722 RepID=A0A0G0STM9_9BACT|nr:MAG: hypothetical protein UT61_C0038G0003 [Candidatus Woesebacteria bacterium GW2011_GWA1_39_8]OGM05582.1 MAG: hypothetical protein A2124_00195 [Candidatus Woesebacteria bacterium GWB1_37_5]OGM25544.1 MAG: hypothetical protein A2715_05870 [Candidatus Woesebacteria bacterium RIFCSPHIGHO2_01_FULL_39_32]OGM36824.1 MAG: hypothetical protein A3F01_00345 [Candidatus Woesebacteria bacterium RIFCSPHIGHO2_12_FULL_38_11]OGM65075.1 MAG: hypothetical protein A2893_05480 [Candidatus Woesebacteria bacteri